MAPTAQKLDAATLALVNAPISEEPLTEDEETAIAETREHIRGGGALVSQEEIEAMVSARLARGA